MTPLQMRNRLHISALFLMLAAAIVVLYIGGVAEIVIIAGLLAYLLDPVVTSIERRGASRSVATTLVMSVLIIIFAVFWYTVIPLFFAQLAAIKADSSASPVADVLPRLEYFIRQNFDIVGYGNFNINSGIEKLKVLIAEKIPNFLIHDSFSFLISLVMIPFVMFFILKDMRAFKKYFISLVPNRYFEFTLDLIFKMETQLGNYLRGQFLDAVVFGLLATFTMWLLNVPYFAVIGLFAGFANLIPFVGPLAGALAAFVAVIFQEGDIMRGFSLLLAFALLKIVDDFLIQPFAIGSHVDLHPMVIALAIIVGGHLFGVLGMLLVVPLLGFVKVVFDEGIATFRKYRFD